MGEQIPKMCMFYLHTSRGSHAKARQTRLLADLCKPRALMDT